MPKHPASRRLAVRAGDGENRNAAPRSLREQKLQHWAGNVPGSPLEWLEMHPKPRSGVDLDDPAARLADRLGDVGADEVDPGDIETYDLGCPPGNQRVFW